MFLEVLTVFNTLALGYCFMELNNKIRYTQQFLINAKIEENEIKKQKAPNNENNENYENKKLKAGMADGMFGYH